MSTTSTPPPPTPGSMTDQEKTALQLASDHAKQLITLASGIIALTIAFNKDFFSSPAGAKLFLVAAWIGYLLSILVGIAAIQFMITPFGQGRTPHIYDSRIRWSAFAQIVIFLLAVLLTVLFGVFDLTGSPQPTPSSADWLSQRSHVEWRRSTRGPIDVSTS